MIIIILFSVLFNVIPAQLFRKITLLPRLSGSEFAKILKLGLRQVHGCRYEMSVSSSVDNSSHKLRFFSCR